MSIFDVAGKEHFVCPRCGCNWNKTTRECVSKCGMSYYSSSRYGKEILSVVFEGRNQIIFIDWNKEECVIEIMTGDRKHELISVPLLPYDIDYQRLQGLLNYS